MSARVRHLDAALRTVVLVCRKCSKKLKGGFGPEDDQRLHKALRRELVLSQGRAAKRKGRRATVLVREVACLDLCPKNAVLVLRADRPGDWLIVPKGMAVGEVVDRLGFGPPDSGRP